MAQDARARISMDTSKGQILLELCGGKAETITGEKISQAAMRGDALALELIQRSAWSLGVGIGNAVNLINPERVILGGGVTKSGDLFWERLRQTARETALPQVRCEVVPAALGDDAPLWGAVALGLARLPRFR
jgi:glucokinase